MNETDETEWINAWRSSMQALIAAAKRNEQPYLLPVLINQIDNLLRTKIEYDRLQRDKETFYEN
jgi:hypothetical protein